MKTEILLSFTFLIQIIRPQADSEKLTAFVNPFIGTSNYGNTFPGAVVPWGMVSVSPHNSPGSPSGYIHGEKYFYGFGHTHLSGTGCADLGSIILTA
ncbi:MAG: glycoside hydrolase family 92 protein, partial [Ignavibacteria bacterium]